MVGSTISHYKILEKIGEGGMGVVYKAEDTKLKRTVAVKFLPKQLSIHGEERERFIHEAQTASSLNHPSICTIHEIDEANDETFIVMEYIDGVTLREWAHKKIGQSEGYRKLVIKETVNLAIQIAEGLDRAHEKGIVHRDIKSENIMVTADGRAKIMDFGLAKLRGVSKLTKTGSTVGTISYMSPEQVEGLETDHRTDIFSCGVVFYEMLSGRLPFQASHEAALIYEIINVTPPALPSLRHSLDDELNHIVMKCIEKERDVRYHSMKDVTVDLRRYLRSTEGRHFEQRTAVPPSAGPEGAPVKGKPGTLISNIPFLISSSVAIVAIFASLWLLMNRGSIQTTLASQDAKIKKVSSRLGLEDEPTWSPDGKFLAYTTDDRGNYDIIVQPLPSGKPIRVVDDPADDMQPAWSPDGSRLAFVSARDHGGRLSLIMGGGNIEPYIKGKGGDIFLIPALGGTPVKLVENGFDPAWSPDGKKIVFRSIRVGTWDIWTIPVEGGTPTQLTNDINIDYQPSWSPDGNWIVFGSGGTSISYAGGTDLKVISSSGGPSRFLTNDDGLVIKPTWTPDGKSILFSSNRSGSVNIWKLQFSAGSTSPGRLERVTVGEGDDVNISASKSSNTISYATVRSTGDIWELTLVGNKLRQVSTETGNEDNPQLDPTGKTLIVQSDRSGVYQIWTMDLNGNFLSQLTSSKNGSLEGRWSPDGKQFAYFDIETEKIFLRSLGDISSKELFDSTNGEFAWSPDGSKLAINTEEKDRFEIWLLDIKSGERSKIRLSSALNVLPSWSPDGTWIVYDTQEKNGRKVWITPVAGGEPKLLTSGEAEYSHPQWSPKDKNTILCLKDHKNICLITVNTGKLRQLTNFTESNIGLDYPSWSFDGTKVYFSLWKKTGNIYTLENY